MHAATVLSITAKRCTSQPLACWRALQNLVALIPTAWLLGCVTEDLGAWLGYAAGGVLNATFGNAPELILSIIALVHGLDTVALTSLVGSVLSNLLLVLGAPCFFPSVQLSARSLMSAMLLSQRCMQGGVFSMQQGCGISPAWAA
jgi:calcium/proton exchanger cax